jgi:hypothetical protein
VTTHMERMLARCQADGYSGRLDLSGASHEAYTRETEKVPPPAGHGLSRRLWANLANAFRQGRCMEHCAVLLCNIT